MGAWFFASFFGMVLRLQCFNLVRLLCIDYKHRDTTSACRVPVFLFFWRAIYRAQSLRLGRHARPQRGRFQHFGLCPEPQQPGCRDVFVGVADLQQQASVRLAGIAGRAVLLHEAVAFAGRDAGAQQCAVVEARVEIQRFGRYGAGFKRLRRDGQERQAVKLCTCASLPRPDTSRTCTSLPTEIRCGRAPHIFLQRLWHSNR